MPQPIPSDDCFESVIPRLIICGLVLTLNYASAFANEMTDKAQWQIEVSNDSPNGFKFSDAYETHAMRVARIKQQEELSLTAALVAPKRPEAIDENYPANRAFGELLTLDYRRFWQSAGQGNYHLGSAVTIVGRFGLDSMQETFHDLLGYRSVKDELVSTRMNDAVMASGIVEYRRPLKDGRYFTGTLELGTRRNALSASVKKASTCESFDWEYHGRLELVVNDEVVSAEPVSADIRHVVPTLGFGFCTKWRGYQVRLIEEISLPRISSDDSLYPMVRLSVGL